MSKARRDVVYVLLQRIFAVMLPLITAPYLARVLGPSGMGSYAYSYSIAYYFVVLSLLGVYNYGARTTATPGLDRAAFAAQTWAIYVGQLLFSALALAAYSAYVVFLADDPTIAAAQGIFVLSAMFDVTWMLYGIGRFGAVVARGIAVRVITTVAIFALVNDQTDVLRYVAIMALSTLISQLLTWPIAIREIGFSLPSVHNVLTHARPNLFLAVPEIAVTVYTVFGKVLLGAMSSTLDGVGYYDASQKVVSAPLSLIAALGVVMLPRSASLFRSGKSALGERSLSTSLGLTAFVSIGIAAILAGVSHSFIVLFLGADFAAASPVLAVLSLTVPLISWANVLRTQYLLPKGLDRQYVVSVIYGAAVFALTAPFAISLVGVVGLALAAFLAEGTVCLTQTVHVGRRVDISRQWRDGIALLSGGLGIALLVALGDSFIPGHWVLRLLALSATGFVVYILFVAVYLARTRSVTVPRVLFALRDLAVGTDGGIPRKSGDDTAA